MDDATSRLRQLVAPLAGVGEADLHAHSQLGGRLKTSIGRATLDALLRREFGTKGGAAYQAATFGELTSAVFGTPAGEQPGSAPTPLPGPVGPAASNAACGVDVELIENLPVAADYWSDDFYREHFTPNEIAYCARQESPREHFAARWCAKEALKKCDPQFLSRPLRSVEVTADANGQPRLAAVVQNEFTLLPHLVSVSHTALVAVAVVLLVPSPPPPLPQQSTEVRAGRPPHPATWAALVLSLAAMALAGWCLVR